MLGHSEGKFIEGMDSLEKEEGRRKKEEGRGPFDFAGPSGKKEEGRKKKEGKCNKINGLGG
ncbi:MAG: hypothetical protein ACBR12_15265 [Microcoleus sp.]